MSELRRAEFDAKLAALISEYSDVPKGARGFTLFISFAALLEAEKGSPVTAEEMAKACAHFTTRLHGAGLVRR